jgi:hypothetical protein
MKRARIADRERVAVGDGREHAARIEGEEARGLVRWMFARRGALPGERLRGEGRRAVLDQREVFGRGGAEHERVFHAREIVEPRECGWIVARDVQRFALERRGEERRAGHGCDQRVECAATHNGMTSTATSTLCSLPPVMMPWIGATSV